MGGATKASLDVIASHLLSAYELGTKLTLIHIPPSWSEEDAKRIGRALWDAVDPHSIIEADTRNTCITDAGSCFFSADMEWLVNRASRLLPEKACLILPRTGGDEALLHEIQELDIQTICMTFEQ